MRLRAAEGNEFLITQNPQPILAGHQKELGIASTVPIQIYPKKMIGLKVRKNHKELLCVLCAL